MYTHKKIYIYYVSHRMTVHNLKANHNYVMMLVRLNVGRVNQDGSIGITLFASFLGNFGYFH